MGSDGKKEHEEERYKMENGRIAIHDRTKVLNRPTGHCSILSLVNDVQNSQSTEVNVF